MPQHMDEENPGLVSKGALPVAKAVEFSGLTRSELYKRMQRGELAYLKLGRRRLIPRAALEALLARGLAAAGRQLT